MRTVHVIVPNTELALDYTMLGRTAGLCALRFGGTPFLLESRPEVIMAEEDPRLHSRMLFIMTLLYGMYLRISELTESDRWTPTVG